MFALLFGLIVHAAPVSAPTVNHADELESYCEMYLESADDVNAQLPKICLAK